MLEASIKCVKLKANTSSNAAPIIWRPTGRPADPPSTNPQGKTNAGNPAKFTFTCVTDTVKSNENEKKKKLKRIINKKRSEKERL